MAAGKKKNNRNSTIAVVIVFAVLGVIIALAVMSQTLFSTPGSSAVTVKVPLIVTKLTSAADGNEYTVQTKFSVQMEKSAGGKVSSKQLEDTLTEIVAEMDFDSIAATDGVDYLNQYATDALNERLSRYTDTKVYVTDMYVGDRYQLADPSNKHNDTMKGLFQNMD